MRGVRDVAGSSGLKDVHSMNDIDDAMVAINCIVDNEKAMRIPIGFGLAFAFDGKSPNDSMKSKGYVSRFFPRKRNALSLCTDSFSGFAMQEWMERLASRFA